MNEALPMKGIRVIEFTHAWAGPYCGRILADFGADVLKIESASRPDITRSLGPYPPGREGDINASGYFVEWNRGKKSVGLNLKRQHSRDIAKQLVATADVVISNFAPGVLDRLGLGYADLKAVRPDLVMVAVTGFGLTGPEAGYVAFGQQIEALSGLMAVTGYHGGPPGKPGVPFSDPVGALAAALATLAALIERRRSGEGQLLDVSMLEATAAGIGGAFMEFAMHGRTPPRRGNQDPQRAPQGAFGCRDGRWIVLSTPTRDAWQGLCAILSKDAWALNPELQTPEGRHARYAELAEPISAWALTHDAAAAVTGLQSHGVPAALVQNVPDMLTDPQLIARHFFASVPHPIAGARRQARFAGRFGEAPIPRPAPCLGADTESELARQDFDRHLLQQWDAHGGEE